MLKKMFGLLAIVLMVVLARKITNYVYFEQQKEAFIEELRDIEPYEIETPDGARITLWEDVTDGWENYR